MKTSSAKSKGRRAAAELRSELLSQPGTGLEPDDIVVTSSGETGEDLKLSPKARAVFPFNFEVKNVEKINIWQCIKQAKGHGLHIPAVVFKKNHQELHICLSLKDFLSLYKAP